MGKNKKSQRTKGNTRPSSSGYSAELLSTSGFQIPDRMGFTSFYKDGASLMPFSILEDVNKASDGNSRLIMKKMLKRDAVTKLKALQELMDYCSEDDCDTQSFLPFWPRLFNKLALDSDKRVREMIHKANEVLVTKVKKDIVPFLKGFMGTWLICQCDPYAPAASAAQSAFSSVFSPQKQSYALMFCQAEIIGLIRNSLLVLTTDSFAEPNGGTAEECGEKYQLVLTCALYGMKLFISTLSEDDRSKILGDVSDMVSQEAFWSHSKSKIPQVCAAWYGLISTLCSNMPTVFKDTEKELISSVMNSLSEGDPIIAPAVWECVLLVIMNFEDCWQHINIDKTVLPQLWDFLKHGGKGNAVATFPCLLPFLSKLPESAIGKNIYFYKKFFGNMRESLHLYRLKTSEFNAIVKAFLECIQYACDRVTYHSADDRCLIEHLITEQLVPLVKSFLKCERTHGAASSFYSLLGQLLQHFEAQVLSEGESNNNKVLKYDFVLSLFWKEVTDGIEIILNKEHELHEEELHTLGHFFRCAHQPSKYPNQRKKKVQLQVDSVKSDEQNIPSYLQETSFPKNTPSSSECPVLFKQTVKICGLLCQKLKESIKPCCLKLCSDIMFAASASSLFFEMLQVLNVPVIKVEDAPFTFFSVVLHWTKHISFNDISLDSIADIILCIVFCDNKKSALHILDIVAKAQFQKLLCALVLKILDSRDRHPVFHQWFQTSSFGNALHVMTQRVFTLLILAKVNQDCTQADVYSKTLVKCIGELKHEKPGIPKKFIDRVLACCLRCLIRLNYVDIVHRTSKVHAFLDFLCDLFENLLRHSKNCWQFSDLMLIMYNMFVLSVDCQKHNLPDSLLIRVIEIWKLSIRNKAHGELELSHQTKFLSLASSFLHTMLRSLESRLILPHVVECAIMYIVEVENAFGGQSGASGNCGLIFQSALETVLNLPSEWKSMKERLQLTTSPAVLKGMLFFPIQSHTLPCPRNIPEMIVSAETTLKILITILCIEGHEEDNSKTVIRKQALQHFPYLLWALSYVESIRCRKNQNQYPDHFSVQLRIHCAEVIKLLYDHELLTFALQDLFDLILQDGIEWTFVLDQLLGMMKDSPYITDFSSFLKAVSSKTCTEDIKKYTVMQICLVNAPSSWKVEYLGGIPKDFFNHELSLTSEEEYLGVLGMVTCCAYDAEVYREYDVQEKIIYFVYDLIRKFKCDKKQSVMLSAKCCEIISAVLKELPGESSLEMIARHGETILDILIVCFEEGLKIKHTVLQDSSSLLSIYQTCSLICALSPVLEKETAECMQAITSKWQQFLNDISRNLLELFLELSEIVRDTNYLSIEIELLVETVGQAMQLLNVEQIFTALPPYSLDAKSWGNSDEVAENINIIFHKLTPFLKINSLTVQLGVHSILRRIIAYLPKLLAVRNKSDEHDVKNWNWLKVFPLIEVLEYASNIVELSFSHIKVGDICNLKPYTDAYTYTVTYFLAWAELLEYFSAFSAEERSAYVCYLEEAPLLPKLLLKLICLVPENPAISFGVGDTVNVQKNRKYQDIFTKPPSLASSRQPTFKILQHIACNVYFSTLRKVPALVRTWWRNLDRKTSDIVEKFTSKYVSALLSLLEIQAVQDNTIKFSNMTIKARPSSREVLATYTFEDNTLELLIYMSSNYPLGPIGVDSQRKVGLDQSDWRNYLFQLTTFLNYHNGSIIDAVALWKKNLDKKFEGVEECMICFYVLHSSCCQLPDMSCRTCKKKFHSTCLYKWFSTSNNSTCPLCRNYF